MRAITPQERHEKMTKTPIPKLVTSMALPAMASQIVNLIYNTADTYFVGKISDSASAAVGVNLPLSTLIAAVGCGFAMGASSLISRRLGAKKNEEAHLYGSSAVAINTLVGILLMVLGLLFLQPMVRLFGSTESMMADACGYARWILLAAPFYCMEWALNMILRAEGSATYAMLGITSGGLLNVALDPLFIFALRMGAEGAALATAISQVLSCTVLVIPFFRGKTIVKLRPRYVSLKISDYLLLIKTGIPTVFRQGLATLAMALLNNQAKNTAFTLGAAQGITGAARDALAEASIAGMSIANKLYMWVRNLVLGVGQGFQPVAGYNYGSKNYGRVRGAFWFACFMGTCLCLVASGIMLLFPEQLVSIFRDSPEVIKAGSTALKLSAVSLPLLAYSTFVNQMYQCLGYAGQATLLASCRQGIFYVPAVLLLPRFFGMLGLAATQPVADLATFLVSLPFQMYFFKKVLKRMEQLPAEA